jgi:hypothetical protein
MKSTPGAFLLGWKKKIFVFDSAPPPPCVRRNYAEAKYFRLVRLSQSSTWQKKKGPDGRINLREWKTSEKKENDGNVKMARKNLEKLRSSGDLHANDTLLPANDELFSKSDPSFLLLLSHRGTTGLKYWKQDIREPSAKCDQTVDYGCEDREKVGELRGDIDAIWLVLTPSFTKPRLSAQKNTNRSARRCIWRYRF